MKDRLTPASGGSHAEINRFGRLVGLVTVGIIGLASGLASALTTVDYFPLDDNNSWTFLTDGVLTETVTVQPGTTDINGVATKGLESSDGDITYFTNDANGFREHSESDPSPPATTRTLTPPIVFATAQTDVSDVVNGSGTALLSIPDVSSIDFVFNYTSSSVIEAFETVTVPAGTFDTLRVTTTVRIFGSSQGVDLDETSVQTTWLAKHIGPVKLVSTESEGTETSELTSANVSPPVFNADIVIDFGGIGLWARMNDASWLKLNNSSPDRVVTGDMDGNGQDDVIADFASTLGGIFVKYNLGGWTQLSAATSEQLTSGDLDDNGQDDVVIDLGVANGLWARMNNTSWLKLNNASPEQVVVGDMDGNGADDVIGDFGVNGIFVKRNLGGWVKLHNSNPEDMTIGNLDATGGDDLVVDFGAGLALQARMNDSSWLKLHNGTPDVIATGDVDGNGADDVLAAFASTVGGFWAKLNLGGWTQQNPNAPDDVVSADITGNGEDDTIGDFGSTVGGIFIKRDQGGWVKLHNTSPDSMAPGEFD